MDINYFKSSFNYNYFIVVKQHTFTFSFIDVFWLPHSSFLLSQWFSCKQKYANTNSRFQL